MSLAIEEVINQKIVKVFEKLNLNQQFAIIKISDRPDLSDFQCNGALALAKQLKKNPREIAGMIAKELEQDKAFAKVSVDGPGFLNIVVSDEEIARNIMQMAEDENLGIKKDNNPKKIILDFGGPNVAKAMHVGHLRSGVIGESIRRIEKFLGENVVADVHLGDWGTPMGMILAEIINQDGDLSKATNYNIDEITEFYKKANIRCKEDEDAKEKARIITAELQDGNKEYRKAWQHLRNVSVEAVKANYESLDVHFDLWLGESDAHETCKEIVKIAEEKGISEVDDGATIIRISKDEDKQKLPPVILKKSDGGFTYHTTDIATIKSRAKDLNAQEIYYFVDKRQALHFEQVFKAVEMLEVAKNVKLAHYGFGTVNGQDGKPFKTRDGGVMTLENLIKLSKDKVRESIPEPGEVEGYGKKEIENLVNQVAIGAIKFQDLKNNTASGYIFDLDDFAKFEGKTGPYIQYAIARINSILRKAEGAKLFPDEIMISNREEKDLALKIAQLNAVVWRAHEEKEPSIIAEYAYNLAQVFSSFYNASPIMNEENKKLASSRLSLAKMTKDVLVKLLYLLGIEAPEIMLKK